MNRATTPTWTVIGNLKPTEGCKWIGHFCEFFDDEVSAQACYDKHADAGNCPTKRPYYHRYDGCYLHVKQRPEIPMEAF